MLRKHVLLALAAALLAPGFAHAENVTFKIRSYHRNQVDVAFYSQNRNHSWPGGSKVWVIKDYDVHSYSLTCIRGEKICYGAWVRGASSSYWGGGKGGRQACQKCCFTCNGGETPVINLNAR
jgi:hypothetical protein